MRKILVFLSCFAVAFSIGIGTVLLTHDNAAASFCDIYTTPYLIQTDIPCTTAHGRSGTWIKQCEGWIYLLGTWYECGCYNYRCNVPPRPPDDIPHQDP